MAAKTRRREDAKGRKEGEIRLLHGKIDRAEIAVSLRTLCVSAPLRLRVTHYGADMIEDLKDKVVLITGASSGIGAAAAIAFGANRARVAVHYGNR